MHRAWEQALNNPSTENLAEYLKAAIEDYESENMTPVTFRWHIANAYWLTK